MYNKKLRSEKKLIVCQDGSKTLFSKEFNEPYHSTKDGALHESLQKYVIPALSLKKEKKSVTILDICFGLGYNTLATLYYVKKYQLTMNIEIISPEFDEALLRSLATFSYPKEFEALTPIILSLSKDYFYEDEQFSIKIMVGDARKTLPYISKKIDIIYQDAFSPASNPLLWTSEWFALLKKMSKKDTLLLTYSIAITTRMGLYENGFYIFLHSAPLMRDSTIASLTMLEGVKYIDMELKKSRNKEAKSLKDSFFET